MQQAIFMTGRETADYLKIGKSTLYDLVKQGKVPFVMVGSRMRFRTDEIDKTFRSDSSK